MSQTVPQSRNSFCTGLRPKPNVSQTRYATHGFLRSLPVEAILVCPAGAPGVPVPPTLRGVDRPPAVVAPAVEALGKAAQPITKARLGPVVPTPAVKSQ